MAIHAQARRWDPGVWPALRAVVAVEAIHPQIAGMDFVRKSDRLRGHVAFLVAGEGITTEMNNHGNKAEAKTGKQQVS